MGGPGLRSRARHEVRQAQRAGRAAVEVDWGGEDGALKIGWFIWVQLWLVVDKLSCRLFM